jgi:type II secretory pathway pseudopilin PulG
MPAAGFTYVGLIILVAILSVAATATIQLGSVVQRRDAEQELLYLGAQFRAALYTYAAAAPLGQPRLPRTLDDLLKDPRFPGTRRHLRRVPVDPITGKPEWGLKKNTEGFIAGVHSLSDAAPIKSGNFGPDQASFEGKTKYSEWVFGLAEGVPSAAVRPSDVPKK